MDDDTSSSTPLSTASTEVNWEDAPETQVDDHVLQMPGAQSARSASTRRPAVVWEQELLADLSITAEAMFFFNQGLLRGDQDDHEPLDSLFSVTRREELFRHIERNCISLVISARNELCNVIGKLIDKGQIDHTGQSWGRTKDDAMRWLRAFSNEVFTARVRAAHWYPKDHLQSLSDQDLAAVLTKKWNLKPEVQNSEEMSKLVVKHRETRFRSMFDPANYFRRSDFRQ